MKNIKKRIDFLMVLVVVAVFLNGCTHKQAVVNFSDSVYSAQYENYVETSFEWAKKAEKLDSEIQQNINKICYDLCTYFNDEYDAKWNFENIEAYSFNLTDELKQVSDSMDYGALYEGGRIYVDDSILEGSKDKATYILAHELIHYLYEYNSGDEMFVLYNKEGECCGRYLDEAFVDSLARKFILAKNPDVKESSLKSGYQDIRLCVDLLAVEETDIYQYFFRNDIEGFKKKLDKKAKSNVICKGDSPFEKMVSMMDEITVTEDLYVMQDRLSSLVTFLAAITSSENSDKFIERASKDGYDFEEFSSIMMK